MRAQTNAQANLVQAVVKAAKELRESGQPYKLKSAAEDRSSSNAASTVQLPATQKSAKAGNVSGASEDDKGEAVALIYARWKKLERDLGKKRAKDGSVKKWDYSKIPDIYDCIKYDVLHNHSTILDIEGVPELYIVAKSLADIIIPQEYGMTTVEKLGIGAKISQQLVRKILGDFRSASSADSEFKHESLYRLDSRYLSEMDIRSAYRHVRTRLYFTSESHIHALLNVLRYADHANDMAGTKTMGEPIEGANENDDGLWLSEDAQAYLSNVSELNYLTHIVFRLYELVPGDDIDDDGDDDDDEEEEEEECMKDYRDGDGSDTHDHFDDDSGKQKEDEYDDEKDNPENTMEKFRVEISFSAGMDPVPIEAKGETPMGAHLEEVKIAEDMNRKIAIKIWRDKLDHTLPVEKLVIVSELSLAKFEMMMNSVLSRVKAKSNIEKFALRQKSSTFYSTHSKDDASERMRRRPSTENAKSPLRKKEKSRTHDRQRRAHRIQRLRARPLRSLPKQAARLGVEKPQGMGRTELDAMVFEVWEVVAGAVQ